MIRDPSAANEPRLDPFYPVLPDAGWIARLVPLGLKLVQLRFKDGDAAETRRQISQSMEICAANGCQLIVNDYWREAIALGADYIHLGQEDLAAANVEAIKEAKLRLGVSTHDHAELQTALAVDPDYVALGPIYETKLKKMKWSPQGLERVGEWHQLAGRQLVAIGGITLERAEAVRQVGASSIAVVTDLVTHETPEARVEEWLAWSQDVVAQSGA